MAEAGKEQSFVNNMFGTVTNKRVTYYRKKSWFSGGSQEDVPLRHVTSVRLETSRSVLWGIIWVIVGLGLFAIGSTGILLGIISLLIGLLLLYGSPAIAINTAGGDLSVMKGWPWNANAANEFVRAVRGQLFEE